MSRSNPTDGVKNPATRWFEWAGGDDAGFVKWYDKEAKHDVKVGLPFTFLFLDELTTIKGFHEPSQSGIYSNEIRDTRQEVLVVKSFRGGEIASGLYQQIKDRVKAKGGGYCSSVYIAFKNENGELAIGNIAMKGAASGPWMDFKRECPTVKGQDGKSVPAYYAQAVQITGFIDGKKGKTEFRSPVFGLKPTSSETNQAAVELDKQLQAFLVDYLKRPKAAAATAAAEAEEPKPFAPEEREPAAAGAPARRSGGKFDDFEDDIPF